MRTGILGGTFDPIHKGHLAAARVAMNCAALDRVIFVPSASPPHRDPAEADAGERLEMTRLAVEGELGFEVSDIEVRRGGKSYTVDTLRALTRQSPDDDLYLILGWDAAKLLDTWREPGEVLKLATVLVVARPGAGPVTGRSSRALVCDGDTPDISGSELRDKIARGEPVDDCLPPAVERYIAEHRLYMDNR